MRLWPIMLLGGLVVAAEACSYALGPVFPWGSSSYRALPPGWFLAATIALVAVSLAVGLRSRSPGVQPLLERLSQAPHSGPAAALLAAAIFWIFRARHLLLGDGLPLAASVLAGERFHPLEPLSMQLQAFLFGAAKILSPTTGGPSYHLAWDAIAVGSTLAGAVFCLVAWHLAREIARDAVAALLCWAILMSQGYVLLFFGYVENYAYVAAASAVYVLVALRFLNGRAGLAPVGAAVALCVFLHLSAAALLPSFALLILFALRDPARRREAVTGLLTLGIVVVLGLLWTRGAQLDYSLPRMLAGVTVRLLSETFGSGLGDHLSATHFGHVLNKLLLVGPLGAWWFAAFVLAALRHRSRLDRTDLFLVVLGGTALSVCWLAGESNLGHVRNWDLLATPGFLLAAGGLAGVVRRAEPSTLGPALALALAVSLYHTVPWVAVNASEASAVRWFSVMPPRDMAASTIGYWEALRGRNVEAEGWLRKAVEASPENTRAWMFLGRLYVEQGRNREAAVAFRRAAALRPDIEEIHVGAIRALVAMGAPDSAIVHAESLVDLQPQSARSWALYGVILAELGRTQEARDAIGTACNLAPSDSTYREALRLIDRGAAADTLRRLVWARVIR